MKDRMFTLLGAALAFYLLFQLLFPNTDFTDVSVSLPTTEDRGKYGLAGIYQWLTKSGVPVYSLRERYQLLVSNPELSNSGNLLICSLPQRLDARSDETMQLLNWLREGNHILLLVAMSDWPQWARRDKSDTVTTMLSTLGLEMTYGDQAATDSDNEDDTDKNTKQEIKQKKITEFLNPKEHERKLEASMSHPITKSISSLQATWLDSEGLSWKIKGENNALRSMLVLFNDNENKQPAVWLGTAGEGTIIITRHADLIGNTSLNKADNARFVENLVNNLLENGGKVIFDDMHQGLSAIYDPDAFFRDPRLHHTLWFMLALWIIYIMGHTNRFSPAKEKKSILNLRGHIKGIGNLFARRLHSSAVATRYAQHFFNEVRSYYGLAQNSLPVWELLETNAAIEEQDLHSIKHMISRAQQHKNINLVKLTNMLNSIRRKLR